MPDNANLHGRSLEETLSLLKKIAVWGLVFCAVATSPVILFYGVPFGIGIVPDLVRIGADHALLWVAPAVWVGWVCCTVTKMRAT